MRAAGGVEVRGAVAAIELVGRPDPLSGSANVAASIAGGDRAAADEHHGVEIVALPGQRPRHRLVQEGRPLLDAADRDQGSAKLAPRTELEIGVGGCARDRERLARVELALPRAPALAGHVGAGELTHPFISSASSSSTTLAAR